MEEEPTFLNFTEAETSALDVLMPDETIEIITSGIRHRHFLKLFAVTGTSLLAAQLLGIEQLMARGAPGNAASPLMMEQRNQHFIKSKCHRDKAAG